MKLSKVAISAGMAIFSEGEEVERGDVLITVWVLGCSVISVLLNPLLLLYNYRPPHSVQRVVYRLLSTLDLLLCLLVPLVVVHNALVNTDCLGKTAEERRNSSIIQYSSILYCSRNATTLDKLYSLTTWSCVYLPPILTAVLTTARLYHIKYPLLNPRHKEILYTLLLLSSAQVLLIAGTLLDSSSLQRYHGNEVTERVMWWGPLQAASNIDVFHVGGEQPQILSASVLYFIPFLAQLAGLVATVLTIVQVSVVSGSEAARQAMRSSARITKKILMTNTGSVVTTIVYLVYLGMILRSIRGGDEEKKKDNILGHAAWTNILASTLAPCLISAVNPLIFMLMTPDFISSLKAGKEKRKTRKKRERSTDAISVVFHAQKTAELCSVFFRKPWESRIKPE